MPTKRELIDSYIEMGWKLIPVRAGGKGVRMAKGQSYTDIIASSADDLPGNIGLILGEISANVVDVDIDDERALPYAHRFLPETPAVFGRKGKPQSHWFYTCEQARTCKYYAKKEKGAKPIEIRATQKEQTVIPPSIHPSKEAIEWHNFGPPAPISFSELQRCVATLTIVPIIEEAWAEGSRNDLASAISGFLLNNEVSPDLVQELISVVCENCGDDSVADRLELVTRAEERITEGKSVKGFQALQELLGDEQAQLIGRIFKVRKGLLKDQSADVDYVLTEHDVNDAHTILNMVLERQRENPTMFTISGMPSILHASNTTFVTIRTIENIRLSLNRRVRVGQVNHDGVVRACKCIPDSILNMIKEMLWEDPDWLPVINSITASPFVDSTGVAQDRMGYHEYDGVYSFNVHRLPPINGDPSPSEVADALAVLDDVLCDFPFAHQSDKAHCLAYIILPFIREHIKGLTPLHFVDKPVQGTGGTLLCQLGGAIAYGEMLPPTMLPRTEEEFGKVITAKSKSSNQHMFFDNVRFISSDHYASMLTSSYCEGRVLGRSEMISIRNNFIHIMSGNNIVMDADFNRRLIRILLDANVPRPELRVFKHPYITQYVLQNRSTIVAAIMTIVARWFSNGMPLFTGKLKASFEDWSQVMGGILECAGVEWFLDTPNDEHSIADIESADLEQQFCALWFATWLKNGRQRLTARQLYQLAKDEDLDIVHGFKGEHTVKSFGRMLSHSFKRKIKTVLANDVANPQAPPVAVEFKCDCQLAHNQLEWQIIIQPEMDELIKGMSPSSFYDQPL
jgi:hypothetical protein